MPGIEPRLQQKNRKQQLYLCFTKLIYLFYLIVPVIYCRNESQAGLGLSPAKDDCTWEFKLQLIPSGSKCSEIMYVWGLVYTIYFYPENRQKPKCKESVCNAEDRGLIPGSGRSSGEGNGNTLQYSCLENSMDRDAWGTPGPWGLKESDMTE